MATNIAAIPDTSGFGNSLERIWELRREAAEIRSGTLSLPPPTVTGIYALDRELNGGIPLEKLTVIAARTSHGKTATAVRLAVNMAMQSRFVNVLWLEDKPQEFDLRAIAVLSRKPLVSILAARRAGTLDSIIDSIPDDRLARWQFLRTVWMPRPTVQLVEAMIRRLMRHTICIVDHLGEIRYPPGNRYETMGDALRSFRQAAWESETALLCMTQLNRQWDQRKAQSQNPDSVPPVLSDIENSGQIEQIARYCMIAEKRYQRDPDGRILPTGEYVYHVYKPYEARARCRWDDSTATPDNYLTDETG